MADSDTVGQALERLSFFAGACSPEEDDEVILSLVETILAVHDAPVQSIDEVINGITTSFQVRVTIKEIEEAAELLSSKGMITRTGYLRRGLVIADSRRAEIRTRIREIQALEGQVFSEWRLGLRERYSVLSDASLEELEADLRTLLTRTFVRYGVDCASLLHAGSSQVEALYQRIRAIVTQDLPQRTGLVCRIRNFEFLRFFREAPSYRTRFFGHLLRSSYILHTSQIDPNSFRIVKEHLAGKLVFLDTNMIFAVQGLDGEPRRMATRQLLKSSKELGMTVRVTRRSVNEFLYNLGRAEHDLEELPPLDREMAKLPAEMGEEGILKAYYDQYARYGTSLDLFLAEHRVAAGRLSEYGIEVGDELEDQILESQESRDVASLIYEDCHEYYEQASGHVLPMQVCDHDAFHVVLVQKRRGKVVTSFVDASAWFVTWDAKLPRFARMETSRLGDVPFCAPATAWLSFTTGLNLRSEDYEATAASMLWSSGLQTAIELPVDKLARVAATLQSIKDKDSRTATLILLDTRFAKAMKESPPDRLQLALPQLIDDSVLSVLHDYEAETGRAVSEARKGAEEARARAQVEEKRIAEEAALERDEAIAKWSGKLQSVESQVAKLEQENKKLQQMVDNFKRVVKVGAKGIASIVIAVAVASAWWVAVREEASRLPVLLASGLTVIGGLGGCSLWFGWQRVWQIVFGAAAVATLIVFLFEIWGR